jgi:hypothetical protein
MNDLKDRQRRAALELNPEELKFANLWLDRSNNNLTAGHCVLEAYPGHKELAAGATTANRLLKRPRILNYLDAMGATALETVGESFSTSVEYWRLRAMSAFEILKPYCELIDVSLKNQSVVIKLYVSHTRQIPDDYQQYVKHYERWGSGYLPEPRELYDSKERNKAREMLDKITGNNIDRIQLSGNLGQIVTTIPEGATANDIADIFTSMVKS